MPAQPAVYTLARIAARYQLGDPLAFYESRKETWWHHLPGVFALLIGCAILYYFFHEYDDIFRWWPVWQMIFVPLIGAGWIGVAVWMLLAPWLSPEARIFVYAEGLIYVTREVEVIRWGQMERIWKDIRFDKKMRKVSSYVIRRNDQAFFELKPNLIDGEKLGMLLEGEITRRLLPRAIDAFNAGDPILFDDIAISVRWLRIKQGHKKLLWSEFERIHIDERTLEIYQRDLPGVWASLKVAAIPNVEILTGLISHAQKESGYHHLSSITTYRAGLAVAFGPLAISQQGIKIKHAVLPWSEVVGISVGESEVMIKRKGHPESWDAFPIWMIPDASSLKELINYIMRNSV